MTKDEEILILSHHPKIGAQTIKKLMKLRNNTALCSLGRDKIVQVMGQKIADFILESINTYNLDEIKLNLKSRDIGYISYLDSNYPKRLKEIPDHPAILYIRGDVAALNHLSVGIVGSRKYTPYGARVASKFAYQLAGIGVGVVSGLALGIDTIAHTKALDAGGLTVAVLGCGIDKIYPISNNNLAQRIIKQKGAIISEYPPGTEPYKSNFPARNRIIAGLCLGVLVVEAAKESGALITAMAALDYNREVFAIPGPIDSDASGGTNELIQQGAKLVTDPQQMLDELNIVEKKNYIKAEKIVPKTDEEKIILKILGDKAFSVDDIVRATDLNIASLSFTLTMLEMKGILENVGGLWKKKL